MAQRPVTTESAPVRWLLIGLAFAILTLFLLLPLAAVFIEAFRRGWEVFRAALTEDAALSAIKLTLLAAAISVILSASAAWLSAIRICAPIARIFTVIVSASAVSIRCLSATSAAAAAI